MERTYATIDKSAWGPGDWQDEPDKVQWVDEATGLDCLAVRHPRGGFWCGYVGVPPEHPLHGLDYDKAYDRLRTTDEDGDTVWPETGHGDLTFAGACQDGRDESEGICHVPEPGRPDNVWWLGFDCAHAWDFAPGYADAGHPIFADEQYRDLRYVRRCTANLAATVAAPSPEAGE